MLRSAIACLCLLACSGREGLTGPAGDEKVGAVAVRSTPPSSRDVMDAVLRNAAVKLSHASCEGVTGIAGDDTVGDYVAHLLAQLAAAHAEGTAASLIAACDPGASAGVFRCRFEVHVKAEDPWRYGLTFDLHADGKVAESSIECPGAA